MAKCYQCDHKGFFVAEIDDDGGFLPAGAIYEAPDFSNGYIPRWNGAAWEQVENHKGEEGYINGETFTIKAYGPLPDGWSETAPPPDLEEVKEQARSALRQKRKNVEYGGFELDGQHWDSSEKDELRLNSVTRIFESGVPQYEGWKISEGVYITLTPGLVRQAALAFMEHYGKCFAVEAAKLAEIEALTSAEAVKTWLETKLDQGW